MPGTLNQILLARNFQVTSSLWRIGVAVLVVSDGRVVPGFGLLEIRIPIASWLILIAPTLNRASGAVMDGTSTSARGSDENVPRCRTGRM